MGTRFSGNERLRRAAENNPPLKRGERGPAVQIVQQALIDAGFPMAISAAGDRKPDGVYGGETYRTVRAFQSRHRLSVDGKVGKDTLAKLEEAVSGKPVAAKPPPQPRHSHMDMLVDGEVSRPEFRLVQAAYQSYLLDSKPCKGIKYNCAARMSVALGRCGWSTEKFPKQARVHKGRASCQVNIPHIIGARELAKHLRDTFGLTRRFKGRALREAKKSLSGQRGIIYFDDCFKRDDGSAGDHIDIWDGRRYFNEVISEDAAGRRGRRHKSLFDLSDEVWFIALP